MNKLLTLRNLGWLFFIGAFIFGIIASIITKDITLIISTSVPALVYKIFNEK